ncbi:HAMP domain-containing protein [Streptomyces tsukubensis]|uniref:HAMP domain-containing protein n=1 Tax=Streptomyces tsukubensis TaxID=83656 RepID=UPI00098F0FB9|nr:HAMP domain-containing protein [Streptomyces tsukubensis]QFR97662.1 HAMP domain-containing protein [Streptomyces tsukubensis]
MRSLRDGDFTARVREVPDDPTAAELTAVFHQIADRNRHLADELTRVRREVVRHGRLDERLAASPGQGSWTTCVYDGNTLLDALVAPAANATRVLDAVAGGDLTQRVDLHDGTRQLRGDLRRLGRAVNAMVDQLSLFTGEVSRVAREVGTEGRLSGRAKVRGLSGSWREVTESVNTMASRLTAQVRDIAAVTTAVARGDLTRTVTVEATGELLELKLTVNTMVDQLSAFADEVTRVAREVGTEGNLGGRATVRGVSGVWKDLTDDVNFMASNLTSQVRDIARVTTAVANGDLSKKITVDARGEILELKTTVNTMVEQLRAFADEVTRVAREVGTDGRLGGRARVHGVTGLWKDLTNNVNYMAENLTSQVRNIAQVATAVAQGDLSKKIDVDARGEILELKTTINTMVDTLSSFSSEVTRVAREVGSEGRLGGQARVEGVHGTWKRLTTNVNELALNLTTQVRALAEVASSVAQGDMSRSITVETRGEVSELKDNINLMVSNLRETRAKDWLESNLARLAALMQGHRDLMEVADLILRELTPLVNAQYGAFFLADPDGAGTALCPAAPAEGLAFIAGYGAAQDATVDTAAMPVHGLVRQAALERKRILVEEAPPDYITINSGLGEAAPASVIIIPILFEDKLLGVIELASFSRFSDVHLAFFDQFVSTIGVAINTIIANSRTESLLGESQRLAIQLQERSDELQRQQGELRRSNAALEEKAALLATSSRYKSEFLANMSHELRTPLNSLLILARLLADNSDGRLSEQDVQFASTIHRSGADLLQLINDILDLSKIEAGRMDVRPKKLPLIKLLDYVHDTFRPVTLDRGLAFEVSVGENAPREMYSDEQRLQQVLRNLLSNAIKFTAHGKVELRVHRVENTEGRGADDLIAFVVRDTGIGIAAEKLPVIFEAFQQADGTTNRKYGGTGLGLSISRELAGLLGGRIVARSRPGEGSTFTLYVPVVHPGQGTDLSAAGLPTAAGRRAAEEMAAALEAAVANGPAERTRIPGQPEGPGRPERGEVSERNGEEATKGHAVGPASAPLLSPEQITTTEPEPGRTGCTDGEFDRADTRPFTVSGSEDDWPMPSKLESWTSGRAGDVLAGCRVLIVDDDIRNVFALTHVLGRVGMPVLYAENGREGIETLGRHPDVRLVLMDIMMPEMDGYQTIAAIRETPRWAKLPLVALTAKAMPGDREKSIACGANDYVPKPVDIDQLLTVVSALLDPEHEDAEQSAESPSLQEGDGAPADRTRRHPPSEAKDYDP